MSKTLKTKNLEVIGILNSNKDYGQRTFHQCEVSRILSANFNDIEGLAKLIQEAQPNVIFNLVGFSSVSKSFLMTQECFDSNLLFYDRLLKAITRSSIADTIHVIQCSSSEMYANTAASHIDEQSQLNPASPYGISKAAAHLLSNSYRKSYNLKISNMILFNHESELRNENFFFRRATKGVVDYFYKKSNHISVSSLNFYRDWSFAGDIAKALHLVAQERAYSDFVVSSGVLNSGRDFFKIAFSHLGITQEINRVVVESQPDRPFDHKGLLGDSGRIKQELGWLPKLDFRQLVIRVIDEELATRKMSRY